MLLVLGAGAMFMVGFILGLMYAKRIKDALSSKVDG